MHLNWLSMEGIIRNLRSSVADLDRLSQNNSTPTLASAAEPIPTAEVVNTEVDAEQDEKAVPNSEAKTVTAADLVERIKSQLAMLDTRRTMLHDQVCLVSLPTFSRRCADHVCI